MTTPNDDRSTPCAALAAEDLVAWTDGELTSADAARVAAHVAACPACSREATLLRRSGELVAALAPRAASASFADRVGAAVRDEAAAARPRARMISHPAFRAAAAAVVVAALAAGVWLAGRGGRISAREEEAIAADLLLLANLDALEEVDADALMGLADDLDVLDAAAEADAERGG